MNNLVLPYKLHKVCQGLLLTSSHYQQLLEQVDQDSLRSLENLTLEELKNKKLHLYKDKIEKVVFVDRDGTIHYDGQGYNRDYSIIELIPGVLDKLLKLKELGYLIVIVTNQSGIGRKIFSREDFFTFMDDLTKDLFEKAGFVFDAVLWSEGVDSSDLYRKPNTGLFDIFSIFFNVDKSQSVMIGDVVGDMLWGDNVGVTSLYVETGRNIDPLCQKKYPSYASLGEINLP